MKKFILFIFIFSFLSDLHASELHEAVYNKDLSKAKRLIKQGANLNAKDKWGYTPLHLASSQGDVKFVELFIENKADINIKDSNGQSPLHKAFLYNRKNIFETLLKAGADLGAKDKNGHTPIYMYSGNLAELKKLIKEDQFNKAMKYLHSETGSILQPKEGADLLIPKGINLEHKRKGVADLESRSKSNVIEVFDENLHRAIKEGDFKEVNSLIEKGVDIKAELFGKESLLHLAAGENQPRIAETLIKEGIDVNVKNEKGETPLHYASRLGHKEVAEILIKKGAYLNAKSRDGYTPLMEAVVFGKLFTFKTLMKHGADVKIKNNYGHNVYLLSSNLKFHKRILMRNMIKAEMNKGKNQFKFHSIKTLFKPKIPSKK